MLSSVEHRRAVGVRALVTGALLVFIALVSVVAAPQAGAHVRVTMTSPKDGGREVESPTSLEFEFSEPIDSSGLSIVVSDASGRRAAAWRPEAAGGREIVTTATLPLGRPLPAASYAVDVIAEGFDGHVVTSRFGFVVGAGPLVKDGDTVGFGGVGTALARAGDLLRLVGIVALGAGLCMVFSLRDAASRGAVRTVVDLGACVTIIGTVLSYVTFGPSRSGSALAEAFDREVLATTADTHFGRLLLLRVVALAALVVIIRLLPAHDRLDRRRGHVENALGIAGFVVLLTVAGASHAAADEWTLVTLVAAIGHVGATALWLGGVLVLASVSERRLPAPSDVLRFHGLARVCVPVALGTGSLLGFRLTEQFSRAVLFSPFGLVLVVKLALVGGLLLAARRTRAVVRSLRTDSSDSESRTSGRPGSRLPAWRLHSIPCRLGRPSGPRTPWSRPCAPRPSSRSSSSWPPTG